MNTLQVLDPTGSVEVSRLHAARLESLAGRTVALVSDDMWQAHRILPLIGEHVSRTVPGVTVIAETEFPMGNAAIDSEDLVDRLVERGVEAAIVGNAS